MAAHSPAVSSEELAAALDSLFSQGDFVFSRRVPPVGRRYGPGNMAARRFGLETVAQVCALRHLGCTMTGIGKIMGQMHDPAPSYVTVKQLLNGPVYAEFRNNPQFPVRLEHYVSFFEKAFKQYPGWRPSGDAVKQAQSSSAGSQYKGQGMTRLATTETATGHELNDARMAEAKARREAARARC